MKMRRPLTPTSQYLENEFRNIEMQREPRTMEEWRELQPGVSQVRLISNTNKMRNLCERAGTTWSPRLHHMNGKAYTVVENRPPNFYAVYDPAFRAKGLQHGKVFVPFNAVILQDDDLSWDLQMQGEKGYQDDCSDDSDVEFSNAWKCFLKCVLIITCAVALIGESGEMYGMGVQLHRFFQHEYKIGSAVDTSELTTFELEEYADANPTWTLWATNSATKHMVLFLADLVKSNGVSDSRGTSSPPPQSIGDIGDSETTVVQNNTSEFINCEGYLNLVDLPEDWCDQMEQWDICGIGNGKISGPGYGCSFTPDATGNCKALNSGNSCNAFQKKYDFNCYLDNSYTSIVSSSCIAEEPSDIVQGSWYRMPSSWHDGKCDDSTCDMRCRENGVAFDSDYGPEYGVGDLIQCVRKPHDEVCVYVNRPYDNPGFYTCDCIEPTESCFADGHCVAEALCPTHDGVLIGRRQLASEAIAPSNSDLGERRRLNHQEPVVLTQCKDGPRRLYSGVAYFTKESNPGSGADGYYDYTGNRYAGVYVVMIIGYIGMVVTQVSTIYISAKYGDWATYLGFYQDTREDRPDFGCCCNWLFEKRASMLDIVVVTFFYLPMAPAMNFEQFGDCLSLREDGVISSPLAVVCVWAMLMLVLTICFCVITCCFAIKDEDLEATIENGVERYNRNRDNEPDEEPPCLSKLIKVMFICVLILVLVSLFVGLFLKFRAAQGDPTNNIWTWIYLGGIIILKLSRSESVAQDLFDFYDETEKVLG